MESEMNIELASGLTRRLAWPLVDLAGSTGTSVGYWKKIIAKGEIAVTKFGARTMILDEDLREWLMKNRRVRGASPAANGNGHKSKAAA